MLVNAPQRIEIFRLKIPDLKISNRDRHVAIVARLEANGGMRRMNYDLLQFGSVSRRRRNVASVRD